MAGKLCAGFVIKKKKSIPEVYLAADMKVNLSYSYS